ncbi:MAG: response regulator [Thermodesulfobacteriota bacterium]
MTSPNPPRDRVLIIDDVPENIHLLINILKGEYATIPATSGQDGIDKASGPLKPDLILMDIHMPELDGFAVCRQLKAAPKTADIPIICITAASEQQDDAKAFALGAADYIAKPFHPATVRARVRHQIRLRKAILELQELYKRALDSNPITGLPGNNSIREAIEAAMGSTRQQVVIYADLDNFKAYNDRYGFARGDEVINFCANLLGQGLAQVEEETFLGHVGGDDFVMLAPSGQMDQVITFITKTFDEEIVSFYHDEDVAAGMIMARNRQGQEVSYPLMSISLGAVDLAWSRYSHYLEVADACCQVKKRAKEMEGSSFFVDRRQNGKD